MNKAIVLGSKSVNSTGLIRSLGRGGINVTFASTYSKVESKYTSDYLKLPKSKEKWINILTEYAKKQNDRIAVFPSDDEAAFWLDDNYNSLKEYFIVPNANGKMRYIADKEAMSSLAKEAGLNVPKFKKISLNDYIENIEYPIILKPYAGFAGDKGDICICRNDEDYIHAKNQLIDKGYQEVLLQQLIEAQNQEEVGLMGISFSSECIIPGVIHKIRSYPIGRGSTSFAKFVPQLDDINFLKIKKFIAMTEYQGIFDIEMIKAYGKYWFIEINYRNGQYGYTPTAAGYNLPVNWLYGMKNEKIEKYKSFQEIYYINERDDYRHVKEGYIGRMEWLKQFRSAKAYGMYCPGDQRPFVRQYVKIPDRVKIKTEKIISLLKDLLIKEEWNVAIREKDGTYLWEHEGEKKKFIILPNTIRYWAADPFIISNQGKHYIFFEMFDRFKSKGLIGYREIINGKIGKMKVAYQADHHLSFPFIFKYENEFYMMPEYSEGNELPLLKAIHFPDKWEKIESLMIGKRVVDSSLLNYKGDNYLVTQELNSGYSSDELSLFIQKNKEWIPHKCNPIVKSLANSRLAGKIFFEKNQLIRVSQDCQNGYGTKLHFNKILKLDENEYEEEIIKTINTGDIAIDSKENFCGIHTYNFDEYYEVIDLKNTDKVKIGNILNMFYRCICKIKKKG